MLRGYNDTSRALDFLVGGGETGALMRAHDWSASPLGPPESWPQSLRSVVGLLLSSKFPMFVAWGDKLGFLYNDPYAEILGAKHPSALGAPFHDIWSEIWRDISPLIDAALAGEATYRQNLPLLVNRKGFVESAWFTFSYSPVRDESGTVAGMFCAVAETTAQVVGERRRDALLQLNDRLRDVADTADLSFAASEVLGEMLGVVRVGYGVLDSEARTIVVERNWSATGFADVGGLHHFSDYGTYIDELLRGTPVANNDVEADPRTQTNAASFRRLGIRAHLDVPVVENGRAVAEMFVHSATPRVWTDEEIAFVRDFAERTRAAVARRAAENALRERDARQTFLLALTDALRPLASPSDILELAAARLGERLGASRVFYAEIAGIRMFVERDYTDGVPSIAGEHSLEAFGADLLAAYGAGKTVAVNDVVSDERFSNEARAGLKARQVAAFLDVVLSHKEHGVGLLAVQSAMPRVWTLDEENLVKEVGERVKVAVERAHAEIAVRESEARFRLMADAVPQIVWITDGEGNTEFFNKQWSDYTGIPYEPTTAFQAAANYIHPDDAAATVDAFNDARRNGATFLVEHRIRSKAGSYRWFLVRGEPYRETPSGEIVKWFGASVDIHDRKVAEEALRKLNENLEIQVAERTAERNQLWTLSQDMLARADYNGMMSAVSPAWTQVLGWSEDELLTRPYATFMHPDDMPPTLEAIARMAEIRQPTRFENRIATRDGGWKPIEWTVAPEPDGMNFIAVGRDLSVSKAREAELAVAQEALRQAQKMEAMGQLTGGVAHDFNNLLTPIVGTLDILQRKGLGGEREQRLIGAAVQSAERAKILVQRLLAFARRQPLQPVAVDLSSLIRNMADLVSSTTGPQIKVVVDAKKDLPSAKADPNQLEMALLNLAVNARDAMPDGGTLRISASAATIHAGENVILRPGEYVCLSVADTGMGMDEATLARAVEPFFSTKGIGKGTGLGLSMVHGLASQLGGALTIKSKLGLGTNIELWLPRTEAAPGVPAIAHGSKLTQDRGTALLVDDEEFVRLSTADMLVELGYHVLEAASAEEALRIISNGAHVDLVVTDHLMAGMSGTELAHTIRNSRPQVPVLIVSGYAEMEGVASDIPRLTKPFRVEDLAVSLGALRSSTGPT